MVSKLRQNQYVHFAHLIATSQDQKYYNAYHLEKIGNGGVKGPQGSLNDKATTELAKSPR
jgi:hypothetical protein